MEQIYLHLAGVLTAGQCLISVDNGVTSLDEVGVAGLAGGHATLAVIHFCGKCDLGHLQGHGINNELESQVLSVSGYAVAVELGLGAVVLAVLVDEVP